jgi:protein-L-isoaspartate(D-aspartate) O-methyltransferase
MINEPAARLNMVEGQLRTNKVTDEAVLEGFLTTPRERFVPLQLRGIAYVDDDIPLGNGRVLMEPLVLARLLQVAAIGKQSKVLEIGCATGYATAILAKLAATVVAVESDKALAAAARANLAALGLGNVQLQEAPLADGWRAGAPYDVILINGGVAEIPAAIEDRQRRSVRGALRPCRADDARRRQAVEPSGLRCDGGNAAGFRASACFCVLNTVRVQAARRTSR